MRRYKDIDSMKFLCCCPGFNFNFTCIHYYFQFLLDHIVFDTLFNRKKKINRQYLIIRHFQIQFLISRNTIGRYSSNSSIIFKTFMYTDSLMLSFHNDIRSYYFFRKLCRDGELLKFVKIIQFLKLCQCIHLLLL